MSTRHDPSRRLLRELNSHCQPRTAQLTLPAAGLPLRSALRALPTTDRAPCTGPLCSSRLAAPTGVVPCPASTMDRPRRTADLGPPTFSILLRTAGRAPCTVSLRPCSTG